MSDALEQALRVLERRERSAAEIDLHLARRGVDADEREKVLETLARTALVDDRRYAQARASSLARRGAGDGLIVHELVGAGVHVDIAAETVAALQAEAERADEIVARRGASAKTARYLAAKGFSEDLVHAVIARSRSEPLG